MPKTKTHRKKLVKWTEVQEFARLWEYSESHVYRVIRGERTSPLLSRALEYHFGVPLAEIELAGRRSAA